MIGLAKFRFPGKDKVASALPAVPIVMEPAPPAVAEVPSATVPALMNKPPVKVFTPLRERVLVDVSFVTEPVPEMMPERVWAAELLYCSVPLLTMVAA